MTLTELLGKDLKGFSIQEYTKLTESEEYGESTTIGFFRNTEVAETLRDGMEQEDAEKEDHRSYVTSRVFLITDGKVGFEVRDGDLIEVTDPEQGKEKARKLALKRLTPNQTKLLGI